MATTATGCGVRGAAAAICRTMASSRSEKRARAARPPWPRRISSRSSRRASSSCTGRPAAGDDAAGVPDGSCMGALHITYTVWQRSRDGRRLRLRAERVEEPERDRMLILAERASAAFECRHVREIAAILDAPQEAVDSLDFESQGSLAELLRCSQREGIRIVVILEARN